MSSVQSEYCRVCEKKADKCKSFFCKSCFRWSHAKCNGISSKFLHDLWLCGTCIRESLPFQHPHDESKKSDVDMSEFKHYFHQLNDIGDSDFDNDLSINCKYYDCSDFVSITDKAISVSFFHLNLSSLVKHFDELSSLFLSFNMILVSSE